jgi:hypothetical protein
VDPTLDTVSTGVSNRIAIAMAIGAAMCLVGLLGCAGNLTHRVVTRARFFCLGIATLCVSEFVVINTIATYWEDAHAAQEKIINTVHTELPMLPRGTTLILDGICPYLGPGIVFEGYWDVEGMLRVLYRDQSLHGDVVSSKMKVREDRLSTSLYGEETQYPFSPDLIVLDVTTTRWTRLPNRWTATEYFRAERSLRTLECKAGRESYGSPIF